LNVPKPIYLFWLGVVAALFLAAKYTQVGADAVATVADAVGNLMSGSRGIRNNNPGNLVRNSIAWQGALTQAQVEAAGLTWDSKFVQFDTPANGIRAIGHVLLSYQARGLSTPDEIIRTYSATDQDAYVANVTTALGLDPANGGQFVQIDVGSNLPDIATAIIQQENGQQPYALSDIQNWVYT
jgi:hypothetical protein